MTGYISRETPFSTLKEVVAPEHSAVLVIDMQNDCCLPDGALDKMGLDVSARMAMIPVLASFLAKARQVGALVVYSQHATLLSGASNSPAYVYYMKRRFTVPTAVEGSWGQGIVQDLAPREHEPIVRKHRGNAFAGTDLDQILRCNGVQTIIATGVSTENCVESTVRDAAHHDYYVVIAEDCVASSNQAFHKASLEMMRARHDVVTSQNIIRLWSAG